MDERLRELLSYFAQHNYNVIVLYNPQCKESTQRIVVYHSYSIPNDGNHSYTINGRDITKLIENLSISSQQSGLGITYQVNGLPKLTYEFSKDYAFELIRA